MEQWGTQYDEERILKVPVGSPKTAARFFSFLLHCTNMNLDRLCPPIQKWTGCGQRQHFSNLLQF